MPVVVRHLSGNNSSESVTIDGNAINDGGEEVSARRIAWGTIYNPTIDDHMTFVYHAKDSKVLVFKMFDMNGKIVLQNELAGTVKGEHTFSLDASKIPSGIYTCRISGEAGVHAI